MTLKDVRAQPSAIETLSLALRAGRAHHAYRFEGADGVGKELAAFGFAQALLCGVDVLGCGACDSCRRVVTLSSAAPQVPLHPDVVLVERGLYNGVLQADSGRSLDEKTLISIQQIRQIVLAQASFPPHEGRARVFLVRAADEMSPGAANALLKTLEEPRPGTHFVLLSARPDRLLPTIRSRTMPVRFAPLPDDVVRDLLAARGIAGARADSAIDLAAGSASAALELADEERSSSREAFVQAVLDAVTSPTLAEVVALGESAERDREALRSQLVGLAGFFARRARASAATNAPDMALALARAHEAAVAAADKLEEFNASTGLTLIDLALTLRKWSGKGGVLLLGAQTA